MIFVIHVIRDFMLFLGISLLDDDMSDFFTVMTMEECIRDGQELLRKEPNANIEIAGSRSDYMAEGIFEGTNRTYSGTHILCAGLRGRNTKSTNSLKPMNIRSELCYVKYNKTLANYVDMDRELNQTSEKTERLINSLYTRFCTFNEKSEKLVSVKVVERSDQCNFHMFSSQLALGNDEGLFGRNGVYIAIIMASIGIVGNVLSLSVYLSRGYQHKQSVYFAAKSIFEILSLICTIISLSLFFIGNDIIIDYVYPIFYQFSLFGRNWITVVIGIEKCIAVLAPFYARAHLRRSLAIKLSLIMLVAAILFTISDFLTIHFISDLAKIMNVDYLFIGGEVKMPIYSVAISFLLPWIIVLSCSVVTVLGIRSFRKKRAKLRNPGNQEGENQTQPDNSDLILPVLLCLVSFLVFSVPVVMHATLTALSSTLDKIFLSHKIIEILGVLIIFFNIIGFSMDFYLSIAVQQEFRNRLKANFGGAVE